MASSIPKPHLTGLVGYLVAFYIVYRLVLRLNLSRQRRAFARAHGCLPPAQMPQRERIFGYDLFKYNRKRFMERDFLNYQSERFELAGATTFSQVFLGKETLHTAEPENLKSIMAVNAKSFGLGARRIKSFGSFLGIGIFTSDGQDWAHSREMLRPNFARVQVADLDMFEAHVTQLIKILPKDGSTVNLSDYFFRLTMDSATEFLFGESTGTLSNSSSTSSDDFAGAFNRSQEYISNLSRLGFFSKFKRADPQYHRDRKLVWDVVDTYVEKGLAKREKLLRQSNPDPTGRYMFIDELVRQTTDRTRIRSELLNILLAGRDTTASLLTNVFFTLSKRPDIWSKLQKEVSRLDGAPPTFEELKQMKYLQALMNESLRLYPVVPINSRTAVHDTVLPLGGGPDGKSPLFVKKNQPVIWSIYAIHRRKDYYGADADEFKPERWLDDPETGRKGLRPGWEYLPFNGGPRICLGQQFALTEAGYTTVRLCQAFSEIESRDPLPWGEFLTLTCVSANGAKVSLSPRKDE